MFIIKLIFCVTMVATSLFSQYLVGSLENSMLRDDFNRRASVYCYSAGSTKRNDKVFDYIETRLGKHNDMYDINYNEINTSQYEILCDRFGFNSYPKQTMLVLYFNKKAVQFPFDTQKTDLLQEFVKLGWVPLETRIENFLKRNPNNQNAISMLINREIKKIDDLNRESLPSFIRTIEKLNNADSMEWLSVPSMIRTMASRPEFANKSILKESPEFQRALNNLLVKIEKEMIRDPYQFMYHFNWTSFACMSQNPDPWKILSQINFPPGNKKMEMGASIVDLAESLFHNNREKSGFDFLNDAENFIEIQDIPKGSFNDTLYYFATNKIFFLIKYKRYSELEKYLRDLNNKVGPEWPKYVKAIELPTSPGLIDIKKLPNRRQIEEILKLPTLGSNEKYFNGILIAHNFSQEIIDKLNAGLSAKKINFDLTQDARLDKNSYTLKNANILINTGSIVQKNDNKDDSDISELMELTINEEYKNLTALEKFIQQNPDNFEAINMYCSEAAKFLPSESLENKLLNYSSTTGIPISIEAYSKMQNKGNWSRLASKVIAEGLIRLKDAPSGIGGDTWTNLSNWEDLDISRNAIDWYGFFGESADFWYDPLYYMQPQIMPEIVFLKYLNGAERVADWKAILMACETRFSMDKKKCQNEQILKMWEIATGKEGIYPIAEV